MKDFIDPTIASLLAQHQLDSFTALWNLQLDAVDEANARGNGWSSVAKLTLGERIFYIKRQANYLTRTLHKPFGEPTFAREMRNIQRYQKLGIPALNAAYFAQRKVNGEQRAILITHALEGWHDLAHWQTQWQELSNEQQQGIVQACAKLAKTLHEAKQVHGCFYPKHIFLQKQATGFTAQLIDLEKTRPILLGRRDRIKDLEPLFRRSQVVWGRDEIPYWMERLEARRKHKESRA